MKDFEIGSITLSQALPQVFASERPAYSEVWLCELRLERGCRVIIEAASGTGKSSLCSYLYGNRTDYLGRISFNDTDISTLRIPDWQALRRRHISYLPQELQLFPELTAMQNIQLKNTLTDFASAERIEDWLSQLGIDSRAHYPVGKMSIGQQQRVGIIRCLCQPFDFLLLDEPVSHLDDDNNAIVAAMAEEAASAQGAGIIATSVGNRLKLNNPVEIKL